MKYIFTILIFNFLGANAAFAALPDGKVHLMLKEKTLVVSVDKGFHINTEAPAKVSTIIRPLIIKAAELKPKSLKFELVSLLNEEKFIVSFYVCDDLATSCELKKKAYYIKDASLHEFQYTDDIAAAPAAGEITYNEHHFIKDNLTGAMDFARKEKKTLIVDFGAPWCPACVRLETEVFNQNSFQDLTNDTIKVTLNSDLASNKSSFKKYEVKLLPTIIVMNSEGEELYRMIDFKPHAEFNSELALALQKTKSGNSSLSTLTDLANKNDKVAIRALAERSVTMNNFKEAVKWYAHLGEESLPYTAAKVFVAADAAEADKKLQPGYLTVLKNAIELYPQTYESLDWRFAANDKDPKHDKAFLLENETLLKKLLTDENFQKIFFKSQISGEFSFPKLEAYSFLVETYKKLGLKKVEIKTRKEFQNEIKKIKTSVDLPGEFLMVIQYQRDAEMPEEELSLKKLAKAYPESHVYHMKLGGFYTRHKMPKLALREFLLSTQLEKPLSLYNLSLLAKVQHELKLKKELKKSIELADSMELDSKNSSESTKEILESLHKMQIK